MNAMIQKSVHREIRDLKAFRSCQCKENIPTIDLLVQNLEKAHSFKIVCFA